MALAACGRSHDCRLALCLAQWYCHGKLQCMSNHAAPMRCPAVATDPRAAFATIKQTKMQLHGGLGLDWG
jgi:hypothetical protein